MSSKKKEVIKLSPSQSKIVKQVLQGKKLVRKVVGWPLSPFVWVDGTKPNQNTIRALRHNGILLTRLGKNKDSLYLPKHVAKKLQ